MSNRIGIRAWIDFAFKKIFGKPGNEICLISFLNSVLDLRKPIASVEFLNPFSLKEFEEAKLVCVDVKATDTDRRVFIVEVQIVVSGSFSKRAVYYASRAYVDQLAPGQGYGKLKATHAVCLLMRPLWNDDRLHHHFRLTEKESGEVLQDAIEIHTVELSKYNWAACPKRTCSNNGATGSSIRTSTLKKNCRRCSQDSPFGKQRASSMRFAN